MLIKSEDVYVAPDGTQYARRHVIRDYRFTNLRRKRRRAATKTSLQPKVEVKGNIVKE